MNYLIFTFRIRLHENSDGLHLLLIYKTQTYRKGKLFEVLFPCDYSSHYQLSYLANYQGTESDVLVKNQFTIFGWTAFHATFTILKDDIFQVFELNGSDLNKVAEVLESCLV